MMMCVHAYVKSVACWDILNWVRGEQQETRSKEMRATEKRVEWNDSTEKWERKKEELKGKRAMLSEWEEEKGAEEKMREREGEEGKINKGARGLGRRGTGHSECNAMQIGRGICIIPSSSGSSLWRRGMGFWVTVWVREKGREDRYNEVGVDKHVKAERRAPFARIVAARREWDGGAEVV
jgi:hypothetical protein